MNTSDLPLIDRHFLRLANSRLLHYRTAGVAEAGVPPLLLAHAGPGSSSGLVPLTRQLGKHRRVIAWDMPGNGDSEPMENASPQLGDYVETLVELLDQLGIEQVDFCGQHTGAHIGCELALRHPTRVRRLMLDGIALFEPELLAQMLKQYAPAVVPDEVGSHMVWAWHFVGEIFMHFPYFLRDPAHRLNHDPLPSPAARQALVLDLMKALPSYHLAYQAAFSHPTAERLALLTHPTLFMAADGDPLAGGLEAVWALVPGAAKVRMTREGRAPVILGFVEGDLPAPHSM